MWRILIWLLPVVDVFELKRILTYYSSLGVEVPSNHALYGMIERWAGYLPVGFVIFWLLEPLAVLGLLIGIAALAGPIELYLMYRGIGPWKFFKGKSLKTVARIFLLEGCNCFGYLLLGGLIEILVVG